MVISLLTILFTIGQLNRIRKVFRKGRKLSVLILEVVPKDNAGYLYRSLKWQGILRKNDINCAIYTLFKRDRAYDRLLNNNLLPVLFIISICKRFIQSFAALNADAVIVRRELLIYNDYGNLFIEKFLCSINSRLILDFDDDISFAKHEPRKISFYGKLLMELPDKFKRTLKFYKYFIPGSNYLRDKILLPSSNFADENILVVPTLVDYNNFEPKKYDGTKRKITFGWSGSPGNFNNLTVVLDTLNQLSGKCEFDFVLISRLPFVYDTKFEMKFIKYNVNKTRELLYNIDIGLMPLSDTDESRGKCGFKLIQYMGCGIVSIASAITVNNEIVEDGVNGFLVHDETQWQQVIETVLNDQTRYTEIGKKAFEKIRDNYSFDAYADSYISFLKFAAQAN